MAPEATATDDSTPEDGAVTIHHLDRDRFEDDREYKFLKDDIRRGERPVTHEDIESLYSPKESVVGTTDLDEAYHRAQGATVNRQQGARHGVPSAHATNVFEVIEEDGSTTYYLVERIGFSEIEEA